MNKSLQKAITKAAVYKGYIIALVVAIILIVIYLKREKITATLGRGTSSNANTPNTSSITPSSALYTNDTVLKKGMKGEKVKELQTLINSAIQKGKAAKVSQYNTLDLLVVDGIFGTKTEFALEFITNLKYKAISINQMKELSGYA